MDTQGRISTVLDYCCQIGGEGEQRVIGFAPCARRLVLPALIEREGVVPRLSEWCKNGDVVLLAPRPTRHEQDERPIAGPGLEGGELAT